MLFPEVSQCSLVQCNTSLSKNYVARSITVVGWILGKNKLVCALWLSVYVKSVEE